VDLTLNSDSDLIVTGSSVIISFHGIRQIKTFAGLTALFFAGDKNRFSVVTAPTKKELLNFPFHKINNCQLNNKPKKSNQNLRSSTTHL
jgi:hypothetical protein